MRFLYRKRKVEGIYFNCGETNWLFHIFDLFIGLDCILILEKVLLITDFNCSFFFYIKKELQNFLTEMEKTFHTINYKEFNIFYILHSFETSQQEDIWLFQMKRKHTNVFFECLKLNAVEICF